MWWSPKQHIISLCDGRCLYTDDCLLLENIIFKNITIFCVKNIINSTLYVKSFVSQDQANNLAGP